MAKYSFVVEVTLTIHKTMSKPLKVIKKVTRIETKLQLQHYQEYTQNLAILFDTLERSIIASQI